MAEKNEEDCQHDYKYLYDDLDSLGNGGSYEVYQCKKCKRISYSMMPD